MTSNKIGILAFTIVFGALSAFSVGCGSAGTVPIELAQAVQHNEPFVYQGFNGPNDYNWLGDWTPGQDRDRYNDYGRDRDRGSASGAGAPCRD